MISVAIHVLKNGEDVMAGHLRYDGQAIHADPPGNPLLLNILAGPVRDLRTGKPVGVADPVRFLRNLRFTYRSAYLRAGEPEEGGAEPRG